MPSSSRLEAVFSYQKDSFEDICDCCGAKLRIDVMGQKGFEQSESYNCPECQKEFQCRASQTPVITLIQKRTDGLVGECKKP